MDGVTKEAMTEAAKNTTIEIKLENWAAAATVMSVCLTFFGRYYLKYNNPKMLQPMFGL